MNITGDKMNIDEKITRANELRLEVDYRTAENRRKIKQLEEENRSISHVLQKEIIELEEEIETEVLEFGQKYEHPLANVTYRKGYVRTTYNAKQLDMYALTHPEVTEFKKETEVKAAASIKWI